MFLRYQCAKNCVIVEDKNKLKPSFADKGAVNSVDLKSLQSITHVWNNRLYRDQDPLL